MLGFFAEGCREIGRKANRFGLRRRLAAQDRERQQALTRLGQTAWQAKVDLTEFADVRGKLEQLDARAGDLAATATRLDAERADLQARRQAEVSRFDALLGPARTAQSEADTALRAARAALAEKDRAIRAIEARMAGLARDLAKLGERPAAPSPQGGVGDAVPGAPRPAGRDQIEAQKKTLAEQAEAEAAAKAPISDEVNTRAAESQRCAAETTRIEGERKAALLPIDADLKRVQQESAGATRERATVGRDQTDRFRDLGAALYERQPADPALTESVQAVAVVDQGRAATQAAIDGSLGLTGAMARRTMAKFWAVVLLVPIVLVAVAYGVYARLAPSVFPSRFTARTTGTVIRTATGSATGNSVAADEQRKDEAVVAFTQARTDQGRRKEAVAILEADVMALGSSADRSSLPLLLTILDRGEPELRAAAAHAIGMIGPTAAEAPALVKALNDPMPTVRDAVLQALGQLPDPGASLLVQRVRAGARDRSRSQKNGLTPTVVPDAARLGMSIYQGATFLAFASDLDVGRVAFSSADPAQKVVDFYAAAAAGRPPVSGEEFTRLYFGGSPGDPMGAKRLSAETEAWFGQAATARMPQAELQAEADRRGARMMNLPLIRYAEATLYGAPVFIATEVASSDGATRAVRYVVVFQDHALGRTGFECHIAAEAIRR